MKGYLKILGATWLSLLTGLPAFANTIQQLIDTEELLFQDLKYYLGVTNAEQSGLQNLLLYMMPPYIDITQAVGSHMLPAAQQSLQGQEMYLRSLAYHNVYTPQQSSDSYYAARTAYCGNTKQKDKQVCDYNVPGVGNDVLALSLLDRLAYTDQYAEKAAYDFILNATNPKPFQFDPQKVYNNGKDSADGVTPDGVKYFNNAFKQMPIMSLAQNSFMAIYAERRRLPNMATGLPVGSNGAASLMELLDFEASRRYSNPDWSNEMNKASPAAVARETANMLALQIFLDVKKYQQMSRIEALMAAQVSLLSQMNAQTAHAETVGGEVNTEELINQSVGQ